MEIAFKNTILLEQDELLQHCFSPDSSSDEADSPPPTHHNPWSFVRSRYEGDMKLFGVKVDAVLRFDDADPSYLDFKISGRSAKYH